MPDQLRTIALSAVHEDAPKAVHDAVYDYFSNAGHACNVEVTPYKVKIDNGTEEAKPLFLEALSRANCLQRATPGSAFGIGVAWGRASIGLTNLFNKRRERHSFGFLAFMASSQNVPIAYWYRAPLCPFEGRRVLQREVESAYEDLFLSHQGSSDAPLVKPAFQALHKLSDLRYSFEDRLETAMIQ